MSEPIPIKLPPGVIKGQSKIASGNRYTDCNNVRFVAGLPEKLLGCEAITETPVTGKVRGMHSWGDNSAVRQWLAMGTAYGLYALSNQTFEPIDITPYESVRTAGNNPIATTNGSPTVTITLTGHGATVGRLVNIDGASAVGGLTIDGDYTVVTVPTTDTFTITAAGNAGSTATGGGAAVIVSIELSDGAENVSTGFGWGIGGYGESTYGTPRDASTVITYPRHWSIDNFGKILLAAHTDGALYAWDPTETPTPRAELVPDAPTVNGAMFVTSERTVFLLGTNSDGSQDKMLMHWSGQNTYTDWDTGLDVSTGGGRPSGSRRLQLGTRIIAGCDLGGNLNLVWTDAALYSNQFLATSSFTYQTRLVGEQCGLIGPDAFVTVGGKAFWAGNDAFFMFTGGVQKIPGQDAIAEWLFKRVRPYYTVKTFAWYNPRFSEIWFGFCLDDDQEPTLAAVFNLEGQFWFTCEIDRTSAATFQGFDTRPVLAGTDGLLYRHDTGVNDAGAAMDWHLETSIMEIEGGKVIPTIYGVILDCERQVGDITTTLTGYDRTNASATAIETETHAIAPETGVEDFRTTARYVKMRLEGSGVDCDFRLGIPKVELARSGMRG
jgi:hypothetical protein